MEVKGSIVPHLKRVHGPLWNKWCKQFVDMKNAGLSSRRIMKAFSEPGGRLLFSWTVIDHEIKRLIETNSAQLKIPQKDSITKWRPDDYAPERTTVWDFRRRGSWAVHSSDYRGNWAPQVPRNLILKYSAPGDLVLDPFAGGGTTLIEAWLLNRRSVGLDVSTMAYETTSQKIEQLEKLDKAREDEKLGGHLKPELHPTIIKGDSRKVVETLSKRGINPGTVDLIATHPPYLDSLRYTMTSEDDLSNIHSIDKFSAEVRGIAAQLFQLLKAGGVCAILIGDTRKAGKLVPLGFRVMQDFLSVGFELKDIIIKLQRQDSSTEFYFNNKNRPDHLLAHEYLYIFTK